MCHRESVVCILAKKQGKCSRVLAIGVTGLFGVGSHGGIGVLNGCGPEGV